MQGNGGDAVFSLTHVADDLAAMMVGVTTARGGKILCPLCLAGTGNRNEHSAQFRN